MFKLKKLRLSATIMLIIALLVGCGGVDKSDSSNDSSKENLKDKLEIVDDNSGTSEKEESGEESTKHEDSESGEIKPTGPDTTVDEEDIDDSKAEDVTTDDTTEVTTKKPDATTQATTKKPDATTQATTKKSDTATQATTKKTSTTTQATTTKGSSGSEDTDVDYGPVINKGTYDVEAYSKRGISDKAYAQAETIINSILKTNMSEVERVKAIHDWLVKNVNYDYDTAANIDGVTGEESAFSAEGALVNKYVVCEGYSEAFMLLCWTAGIEARLVSGDADNGSGAEPVGHEWNVVKIDGKWYQIDVTWDDPKFNGIENDPTGANLRYQYFLLTTADMTKDHTIEEFWNSEKITCTSTAFYSIADAWAIKNKVGSTPYTKVSSYAEADAAALNYLNKGITKFVVVYTEGSLDYNTIMENGKAVLGDVTHPTGIKGYSCGISCNNVADRGYSITTLTFDLVYKY